MYYICSKQRESSDLGGSSSACAKANMNATKGYWELLVRVCQHTWDRTVNNVTVGNEVTLQRPSHNGNQQLLTTPKGKCVVTERSGAIHNAM